jgi:hypothetical protein
MVVLDFYLNVLFQGTRRGEQPRLLKKIVLPST